MSGHDVLENRHLDINRFLSLGAGVQSTALFILGCEGELLPKIDAAIFADTRWEPAHVMTHLANLQRFGAEHGVPVYLASRGSLPEDVLNPQVFATIPAWTTSEQYELLPAGASPLVSEDATFAEGPGSVGASGECQLAPGLSNGLASRPTRLIELVMADFRGTKGPHIRCST